MNSSTRNQGNSANDGTDQVISPYNTTLIGDYIATAFKGTDNKWLVQATGNAMFQSVIRDVEHDTIKVDKKYIFIALGHNQLHTLNKGVIKDCVNEQVK